MARPDIQKVFRVYPDLKPKLDQFVFNDGSSKDLLNLEGTIPVNYKGSTYNIPVVLWVLDSHPYNPPLVFVKPTSTMRIKPGQHVDSNGKVDLPYIRDWQHPRSELMGLIQVLVMIFGDAPPVYTISTPPSRPPYPPQPTRPPYPEQPHPPYPGGAAPYPTASSGYMPMPTPSSAAVNPTYPYMPPAPTTTQPPYPTYNPPQPSSYPGYPPQNAMPPYPTQNQAAPYPTQSSTGFPGYPGYPPATQGSYGQAPATQTAPNTGTIKEEHLRASLLSAVEDKLRRRLKDTFDTAQAEMDVLYKTQRDLQSGRETLEAMVRDLDKEKVDVDQKIEILTQKDREMKAALSRMEHQDKVPIDDAVVTVAPLYKQCIDWVSSKVVLLVQLLRAEVSSMANSVPRRCHLIQRVVYKKCFTFTGELTTHKICCRLLNSFSEEQAVEDAIYYLGEALRRGIIDLDVFLKQVRELSRRQFMLRALIHKCREKAGLPNLS